MPIFITALFAPQLPNGNYKPARLVESGGAEIELALGYT
jgi:hypothetical protein